MKSLYHVVQNGRETASKSVCGKPVRSLLIKTPAYVEEENSQGIKLKAEFNKRSQNLNSIQLIVNNKENGSYGKDEIRSFLEFVEEPDYLCLQGRFSGVNIDLRYNNSLFLPSGKIKTDCYEGVTGISRYETFEGEHKVNYKDLVEILSGSVNERNGKISSPQNIDFKTVIPFVYDWIHNIGFSPVLNAVHKERKFPKKSKDVYLWDKFYKNKKFGKQFVAISQYIPKRIAETRGIIEQDVDEMESLLENCRDIKINKMHPLILDRHISFF